MIYLIKKRNSGASILETIFYIALLLAFSILIINALFTMTKAFKGTTIQSDLMHGGTIMERISREIRQAKSIVFITPNSIKLNSIDETGTDKTIEFNFSNSNINLTENETLVGNLNSLDVSVVNLSFLQINTTNSIAIKIFLTIKSNKDSTWREESFYNTVVFRGIY